jgi:hypothetical protein
VNVCDDTQLGCSCLEYSFRTLVSLHRVVDTAKLMVPCRNSDVYAQCPFPLGCTRQVVLPDWVDGDGCLDPDDCPVVVRPGDPCFVLGFR